MPEPLTIYECPSCGRRQFVDSAWHYAEGDPEGDSSCWMPLQPVRVFREEDVRPLWEELGVVAAGHPHWITTRAVVDAFPAPEEWTA